VRDDADRPAVEPGEADGDLPGPPRLDLEEAVGVRDPLDELADVEPAPLVVGYGEIAFVRFSAVDDRRLFAPRRGEVGQVTPDDGQGLVLVVAEEVADAGLFTVDPRAAHVLQGGALA